MKVDVPTFWSRATSIIQTLSTGKSDPGSSLYGKDCLLFWSGKNPEVDGSDPDYTEASKVSLFLMDGFEFPETLFVFTPTGVCISASEKKIKILDDCKQSPLAKKYTLDLIPRAKEDLPGTISKLVSFLTPFASSLSGFVHQPDSGFAQALLAALPSPPALSLSALHEALLYGRKDDKALTLVREACEKMSGVSEKFRKRIPDFEEEPRTHEQEWRWAEKAVTDEKREVEPLPECCTVHSGSDRLGFVFAPGGASRVRPGETVSTDNICLQLGVSCKGFAAYLARTVFVDPKEVQRDTYALLLRVRERLVQEMKPGAKPSEVHAGVMSMLAAAAESTPPGFTDAFYDQSLGFVAGTGLGQQQELGITAGNARPLVGDSVWVIDLRVEGMALPEGGDKTFSCHLADVLLVGGGGGPG